MVNSNFNFKNHILPDFSITLEILENFGFVLCLFWLVNYERHWYLLSFTIVDKHFFFIWLFLGILALFLNLKTTGKIWFDINKNKFYHSKPTVSEKSLKLPLQSFLLLACSGKICLIWRNSQHLWNFVFRHKLSLFCHFSVFFVKSRNLGFAQFCDFTEKSFWKWTKFGFEAL